VKAALEPKNQPTELNSTTARGKTLKSRREPYFRSIKMGVPPFYDAGPYPPAHKGGSRYKILRTREINAEKGDVNLSPTEGEPVRPGARGSRQNKAKKKKYTSFLKKRLFYPGMCVHRAVGSVDRAQSRRLFQKKNGCGASSREPKTPPSPRRKRNRRRTQKRKEEYSFP